MDLIINKFKKINWKSYALFFVVSFLPIFYTLFLRPEIYGNDHLGHFSIAHNAKWIALIFVVVTETLFFPLVSMFGNYIKEKQYKKIENGLKLTLLFALILILAINIVSFITLPYCASSDEMLLYMQMETISLSMFILVQIPLVFFQVKDRKHLIEFLILQIAIFAFFDLINIISDGEKLFFIPLGQAIAYLAYFIVQLVILAKKYHINIFSRDKLDWHFVKHFYHLANHAFVDAIIVDMILILFIEGFGFNFGVADFNSFHMTVLLMPVTAFVILVRSDMALERRWEKILEEVHTHVIVGGIISVIWTIGVIGVFYLARMNFTSYAGLEEIADTGFYFVFLFLAYNTRAISNIYKAAFHGIGELGYLTSIAIKVAIFVFLPAYIIAHEGNFSYSLSQTLLILSSGILLESALTIIYFYFMIRERKHGVQPHN